MSYIDELKKSMNRIYGTGMLGTGKSGNLITVDINQDISKELAMLRGIDFARRNMKESLYPKSMKNEEFDREIMMKYCEDDVRNIMEVLKTMRFGIRKVIFSNPATIVIWLDGTKTIVKCSKDDIYDPEKGLAMAISKRALEPYGNYHKIFKKFIPKERKAYKSFTVDEYAKTYKISKTTVYRMIRSGDLHAHKDNRGHYLIP